MAYENDLRKRSIFQQQRFEGQGRHLLADVEDNGFDHDDKKTKNAITSQSSNVIIRLINNAVNLLSKIFSFLGFGKKTKVPPKNTITSQAQTQTVPNTVDTHTTSVQVKTTSSEARSYLQHMDKALMDRQPTANMHASTSAINPANEEEFQNKWKVYGGRNDYPHWDQFVAKLTDIYIESKPDGILAIRKAIANGAFKVQALFKEDYYHKFLIGFEQMFETGTFWKRPESSTLLREEIEKTATKFNEATLAPISPFQGEERFIWKTENIQQLFIELLKPYLYDLNTADAIHKCKKQLIYPILEKVIKFQVKVFKQETESFGIVKERFENALNKAKEPYSDKVMEQAPHPTSTSS